MNSSTPNSQNEMAGPTKNPSVPMAAAPPPQKESPPADPPPNLEAQPPIRRGTFIMLAAGVAAGVLAWFLVEHFHHYFTLPPELADKNPPYDPETEKQLFAAVVVRDYKNTALAYGLIGLVLCAFLGLGQGLLRRSSGAAVGGFLLGTVLGAATGAAAGTAVIGIREQFNMVFSVDILSYSVNLGAYQKTVVMHVAAWTIVSVGVGIVAGLWGPQKVRAVLRGFVAAAAGGLVVGLLFPLVAAALLHFEKPELPRPEGSWTVLLWTVSVCAIMGWAVGRVTRVEVKNVT